MSDSWTFHSQSVPVVSIDTQAQAAYVRFSEEPVARTLPLDSTEAVFVAMDLDATGSVVGIEIVGATEFTIKALLEKTPLHIDEVERIDETRYVPATGHA